MEKKKSLKLRVMLIIISILLAVIAGVFIYMCCIKNNNFSPDSDTGFYKSKYMTYNNGVLTVEAPNGQYVDTYILNENKKQQISTNKLNVYNNSQLYDTKIAYYEYYTLTDLKEFLYTEEELGSFYHLYIYDIHTDTSKLIAKECFDIIYCQDKVAYTNELGDIYLHDVKTESTELLCEKLDGELVEIHTMNNYLYFFRLVENVDSYITVFDIKTKNKIADIKIEENFESYIIQPSGNQIIVNKKVETEIIETNGNAYTVLGKDEYKIYDLKGNCTDASDIEFVEVGMDTSFYNGDYRYYSERQVSSTILYERTISNPLNGLYMTNIKTNETTRLSDECRFEGLLATENYLYCYTIDYLIPQGLIKANAIIGYTLKQIPIN